jgi:arylsulfatase A-like enzyme
MFGTGTRKQYVLNNDIAPTFLEAAGAPVPASLQGKSMLPVLRSASTPNWRTDFLYEYEWERDFPYTPTIYGLRTDQYSFMQYYGIFDIDELYDIQKDPDQMNNLLAGTKMLSHDRMRTTIRLAKSKPELVQIISKLQNRMAELLKQTGGDPRFSGKDPEGAAAAM